MKTLTFLLLFILLFIGCNNDDASCPEIETTPAGSIHMVRGVDLNMYLDDILYEETLGSLILSKIDDTHTKIILSTIEISGESKNSITVDNVLVTGEFLDVLLWYESESVNNRCIVDGQFHYIQYVKVDGWMKDTRYETRDCANTYYDTWDIKIDFHLEDGREYRYEISGTY